MKGQKETRVAMCEELEGRTLLSSGPVQAYMDPGGQLIINGTSGRDVIELNEVLNASGTVDVAMGVRQGWRSVQALFKDVKGVTINAGDGNDVITIGGTKLTALQPDTWIYTYVDGGAGNDVVRIFLFDGRIGVNGGDGNDVIDARWAFPLFGLIGQYDGERNLSGGAGNDAIYGSSRRDGLNGDQGNDVLVGGDGDDTLNGGSGRNVMYGGVGNDTFYVTSLQGTYAGAAKDGWAGGHDFIVGGGGWNTVQRSFNTNLGRVTFGTRAVQINFSYDNDAAQWQNSLG